MFENSLDYARREDAQDELAPFRGEFLLPAEGDRPLIYMCGNSLGPQPMAAKKHLQNQLDTWRNLAVEGWFEGKPSWIKYGRDIAAMLIEIIGARHNEITVMNSLTVNLHLLFTTFYRPTGKKHKILMEPFAFPSDSYMAKSQAKLHGYTDAIIELKPKEGEVTINTSQVLDAIDQYADELALVFLGGVNYFTGQVYDMKAIAKKCHEKSIAFGLDLAHAVGNIPLELHNWGVDFAAWCSYKYLNSGPGGIGGIFIHEKHHKRPAFRLEGWWGNNLHTRFKMAPDFDMAEGAEAWQLSTMPIMLLTLHHAALEIIHRAGGVKNMRKKSIRLTAYLEYLLKQISLKYQNIFRIITPENPDERGCQLSLQFKENGRRVFEKLTAAHVIGDWREPDVIRLSPAPLYNTFEEVFLSVKILEDVLKNIK